MGISAQIIDTRHTPPSRSFALRDHANDRFHAIAHMEITLPLGSIAQHLEIIRVRLELAAEVVHVTMGVAFAQDGHEAEDDHVEAESLGIS